MFDFIRYTRGISDISQIQDVRVLTLLQNRAGLISGIRLIVVAKDAVKIDEKQTSRILQGNIFELCIADYITMHNDYKERYDWSCLKAVHPRRIKEDPDTRIKESWHNEGYYLICPPGFWNYVPLMGVQPSVGIFKTQEIQRVSILYAKVDETLVNLHRSSICYDTSTLRIHGKPYSEVLLSLDVTLPSVTSGVLCIQRTDNIPSIYAKGPLHFDIDLKDGAASSMCFQYSVNATVEAQLARAEGKMNKPVGNANELKSFSNLKDLMEP